MVAEVPMEGETIQTLIEEAITLPVQNVHAETSDGLGMHSIFPEICQFGL